MQVATQEILNWISVLNSCEELVCLDRALGTYTVEKDKPTPERHTTQQNNVNRRWDAKRRRTGQCNTHQQSPLLRHPTHLLPHQFIERWHQEYCTFLNVSNLKPEAYVGQLDESSKLNIVVLISQLLPFQCRPMGRNLPTISCEINPNYQVADLNLNSKPAFNCTGRCLSLAGMCNVSTDLMNPRLWLVFMGNPNTELVALSIVDSL